jgi:hypothetical protein
VAEAVAFKDRLRASFKTRPRTPPRSDAAPTASQPQAAPAPTAVSPPPAPAAAAAGGRELEPTSQRQRLAAEFDAIQYDLGGLVYEMATRDHFRLDVLSQRAAKLQAVDAELARAEGRPVPPALAASCPSCSTPLVAGAAFCPGCGRALTSSAPAVGTAPAAPAQGPPARSSTAVTAQGTAAAQPSPPPGAQAGGAR